MKKIILLLIAIIFFTLLFLQVEHLPGAKISQFPYVLPDEK